MPYVACELAAIGVLLARRVLAPDFNRHLKSHGMLERRKPEALRKWRAQECRRWLNTAIACGGGGALRFLL